MKSETKSLFDRIGGMEAVNSAVTIFYNKVIQDPDVAHFFKNVDIEKQATKMKSFLAYAFGAPLNYSGKSMREAHAHMQISEDHFNVVATHLNNTLKELDLQPEVINEVMSIAASTKDDVLGK